MAVKEEEVKNKLMKPEFYGEISSHQTSTAGRNAVHPLLFKAFISPGRDVSFHFCERFCAAN